MAVIDVSNLTYTYPGESKPALKEVSFQVETGRLVAVIGANGAGKSSLCLALAGLIPSLFHGEIQGKVTICGMDTSQHSASEFAERVGLVLQNPANQLSGMRYTIYAEVAFGLENLGIPRAEMPARIDQALHQVGLADIGERSPYSLSGGQQQRLVLASILAMQPTVLVLDEPTSFLDPQGNQALFEIILKLVQTGTTVVIAEHHLEWVARYADRVIALADGEVILDGTPGDVLISPQLRHTGIGWLRYTHAAQMGKEQGLWPGNLSLPVSLDQAVIGFRKAVMNYSTREQDNAD